MTIKNIVTIKTIIKPNAQIKFKKEVARLLNDLIVDYKIHFPNDCENRFKDTFKSNLYYLIDNYYEVKNVQNKN